MVEFSLVVGLFAFFLYGLISFGVVLATKQRVTSAAADAARAAVGADNITQARSKATAQVTSKLGAAPGVYTPSYDPFVDTAGCAAPAECIKVTIIYALQPSPGLGLVVPANTKAEAVVRYK